MDFIERLGTGGPEKTGPETFAPPDRSVPGKRSDIEHVAFLRPQRGGAEIANTPAADLNAAVQRIAGVSKEEINRVVRALENVRDMMDEEGERVSREIAAYASLGHATKTTMQIIVDNLKQWNDVPNKSGPRSVA